MLSYVVFTSQIRSVTQSCPTLCDPVNHSTPGLPVHHQLPEFTQTHVHRISDAIQPSHSSCSQSLPASESFPMSQLFAWGGQSTGVSASASFPPKKSQDWSPLEWTGWISLQSKGLSSVFSNTTVHLGIIIWVCQYGLKHNVSRNVRQISIISRHSVCLSVMNSGLPWWFRQ